jgi:hypothetical protein
MCWDYKYVLHTKLWVIFLRFVANCLHLLRLGFLRIQDWALKKVDLGRFSIVLFLILVTWSTSFNTVKYPSAITIYTMIISVKISFRILFLKHIKIIIISWSNMVESLFYSPASRGIFNLLRKYILLIVTGYTFSGFFKIVYVHCL